MSRARSSWFALGPACMWARIFGEGPELHPRQLGITAAGALCWPGPLLTIGETEAQSRQGHTARHQGRTQESAPPRYWREAKPAPLHPSPTPASGIPAGLGQPQGAGRLSSPLGKVLTVILDKVHLWSVPQFPLCPSRLLQASANPLFEPRGPQGLLSGSGKPGSQDLQDPSCPRAALTSAGEGSRSPMACQPGKGHRNPNVVTFPADP